MGVQGDGTPPRRRQPGQLQDIRDVSREAPAAGRLVRVRRVSAAGDRDADIEDDRSSGVEVTDASVAWGRESSGQPAGKGRNQRRVLISWLR